VTMRMPVTIEDAVIRILVIDPSATVRLKLYKRTGTYRVSSQDGETHLLYVRTIEDALLWAMSSFHAHAQPMLTFPLSNDEASPSTY
jgi:hypothetical protein